MPHETPVTVIRPGATVSPCMTENMLSAMTRLSRLFMRSSLSTAMPVLYQIQPLRRNTANAIYMSRGDA